MCRKAHLAVGGGRAGLELVTRAGQGGRSETS